MISREAAQHIQQLMQWFPAVAITGPRQSGKTTLAKALFKNFEYLNLEIKGLRDEASADPFEFINARPGNLIIDEAQLVPDLFSAIQVVSDKRNTPGQYVLSGSQNFLLSKSVNQSLAGRCAYVDLMPLTFSEVLSANENISVFEYAFRGGYPRMYDRNIPPKFYFEEYVRTYCERDVKNYLDVRNLSSFQKLLSILASQVGNLVNVTNISKSCGVSRNTISEWLSMLEASYVIFRLQPFFENTKKRLTKTPKLFFFDTGLLCYLLGIESADDLRLHAQKGAIIENLVISETFKKHRNAGVQPRLFFYRDDSKQEIDLLDFSDQKNRKAFEIKSTSVYNKKFARTLEKVCPAISVEKENQTVLINHSNSYKSQGTNVGSIEQYLKGA